MRFNQFDCKWNKFQLKNIVNVYDGTHQTPKYTKSGVQFVSVEDIKTLDKATKYISKEAFKKEFKIFPEYGDVLMTRIGDIGTPAIVYNNNELAYYVSLALLKPRTVVSSFLKFAIESNSFQKELWKRSIHVAFPKKINKEEIGECNLLIPSTEEQKQVAEFLSTIDKRIDTQSKIIEDLELLKNKINDNLIYQQNYDKTTPLFEVSTLKHGYAFKSSDYVDDGNFKIVTIGNVTGAKFCDTQECNKVQYIPKDIQPHQKLKFNDILISLTGNVGRVSLCNENNCLLNQRVGILEVSPDVNREFIYHCLSNKRFEQAMVSKGQGAAQLNISKLDIESFNIPLYDKKYQEHVSSVLNCCDIKIQKEKDMLELYKKQKAYLLQNMFI